MWVDFILENFSLPKFDFSYNFQLLKPIKIDTLEQSPSDCHLFSSELMPNPILSLENTSLNQFYDSVVGDSFTSGKTSEASLYPVNNRGNPLKLSDSFFRFNVGNGLYYSQKNLMQSIQVVQGRYVCKQKSFDLVSAGDGGVKKNIDKMEKALKMPAGKIKVTGSWDQMSMVDLANHIADYTFDTCMQQIDVKALEMEVCALFAEFVRSTRSKNYCQKFLSQIDKTNPKVVNFHLKTIFKAKISELSRQSVQKVGQGISAWSAVAQNYFSLSGKIMNYAFFRCLKGNVVYDNRMTPEELIDRTNALNKDLNELADNVVTDYTEYDKKTK